MDEEVAIPFPDVMELSAVLEQGGVGLGREESFRILLALRALLREQDTLQSVRFWGELLYSTYTTHVICMYYYICTMYQFLERLNSVCLQLVYSSEHRFV